MLPKIYKEIFIYLFFGQCQKIPLKFVLAVEIGSAGSKALCQ